MSDIEQDRDILLHSVQVLTKQLDELVGACIGDDNRPKAPDMKTLMKARGLLPRGYKHTLTKAQ